MNVDTYNLDSLRALVRKLEKENKNLKQKLNEANIPYSSENIFAESSEENAEYDLDQGGRIMERYITENMAKWYFSMFWGRDDVYAKRGSKGGYFPQCNNRWNDRLCPKQKNGIRPLVERSRLGQGAHVWIFFKKPIPASMARNFGFMLLDKGSASVNMKSFHYYDRMYPSRDVASNIGNLIALPLQGQALKNGNSAFVDENWNVYPDQWGILLNHT